MLTLHIFLGVSFNIFATVHHAECPPPFEKIGHGCFEVYTNDTYTWYEARKLCSGEHKHLAILDDANLLGDVYDYLQDEDIDVWVGSTDEEVEDQWVWQDGTPVKRGTPFWSVIEEHLQAPTGGKSWNCLSLLGENSFYFSDYRCDAELGVLCQYDDEASGSLFS